MTVGYTDVVKDVKIAAEAVALYYRKSTLFFNLPAKQFAFLGHSGQRRVQTAQVVVHLARITLSK